MVHCPRRSPHSISKSIMRMPTQPKCGEGRVSREVEVIDTSSRSIRRGNGHSTLEG